VLRLWKRSAKKDNQLLDPTWTTPVDSVNVYFPSGSGLTLAILKEVLMNKGKLILKRFNGVEEFEISEAEICAWKDQGEIFLNLEIKTLRALSTLPDTKEAEALPNAEVTIRLASLSINSLIGEKFIVENGMNEDTEEWDGRFY
jgi:hypothetical protein